MKIYRVNRGIIIESNESYFFVATQDWDGFINDDHLASNLERSIALQPPIADGREIIANELLAPIQNQEVWASGVTYINSKLGRQEEAKDAGGGDFYARVYEAVRPELFFKATAHRTVASGGKVRIRKDSTWDVPEPELTLVITSGGKIVGYTIGNDMSSRSIEGENPLYLPQAKTFDGCAGLGPCILVTEDKLPGTTKITMDIHRGGLAVFSGSTTLGKMKRDPEELVSFLYRECSFPYGSLLMTGTGIVPSSEFTLNSGDRIDISIESIGTLTNIVA
jgi:2-dehydro-3-deoxy-D-arabinonate dehydratase